MNAAQGQETGPSPQGATPAVDPALQLAHQKTFQGFVRISTYGAIAIAFILIAMALFLI